MAVTGYTRQAAANIVTGLVINAADHNAEYNQLQSSMDNAIGHDHSGSVSGSGQKVPISTGVSGLGTGVATFLGTPSSANLAAALTNETGTSSVVFSDSPTFTGTMGSAFNISTTGTGTFAQVTTTGAGAIFNFVDRTSSRNWAWYGTGDVAYLYNGSGNILSVGPTGAFTAIASVNTVNYLVNGISTLGQSTNYAFLNDQSGTISGLLIGNGSDPTNYYNNTTHALRSRNGAVNFLVVRSTGASIIGTNTNDNQAAGFVGEYISNSNAAYVVGLSSGVATNVAAITLSAGDWEVYGNISFAGIISSAAVGISTTSATFPALHNDGGAAQIQMTSAILNSPTLFCQKRISIAGATAVYLVGVSVGGSSAGGFIGARRAR